MSINDPLFVVASNYRAYYHWCLTKRHAPHNAGFIYVRGVETIDRQKDIRILFLHGWTKHKDSRAIYNRAILVGRRPA